jgi:hypothetical protein
VTAIGSSTAGTVFRGSQPNERAGRDLAFAGNIDGDPAGNPDFAVGSPGWDFEVGTIHQVLETRIPAPGECSEDATDGDCEIADLSTGARLLVADTALDPGTTVVFDVDGLVDPTREDPSCPLTTVSAGSCTGESLVGLADFDPEFFLEPILFEIAPELDIPIFPGFEYQIDAQDVLTLKYCDAGFWTDDPASPSVTIDDNRFVLGRLAARATVDRLHLWGVFVEDADCDSARDGGATSCDCDDGDATVWAPPDEARGLVVSRIGASASQIDWNEPGYRGGAPGSVRYDVIRSSAPDDFETTALPVRATCLETNGTDTRAVDPARPANGAAYYYIVRAENGCGAIDPGCCPPGTPGCPQPPETSRDAIACGP